MKKYLSMLLCMAMVFTLAVGAAPTASASDGGKTTIRFAYWEKEDAVAGLLDYLAEAVPDVEIEFQFIATPTTPPSSTPSSPPTRARTSSARPALPLSSTPS